MVGKSVESVPKVYVIPSILIFSGLLSTPNAANIKIFQMIGR